MNKLAVIGEKNIVSVFRAVGAEVFPFTNPYNVKEIIRELVRKEVAVILVTENLYNEIGDFLSVYKALPYPIIMPIPDGVNNEENRRGGNE